MARPARAVAAIITGTPAVQVGSGGEHDLEARRGDQKRNAAAPDNSDSSADNVAPGFDCFASGAARGEEDFGDCCTPGVDYVHEVLRRRLLDPVQSVVS